MADTKIQWADKVWNPVVGCTKCSPGCLNCYAERMAARLSYMGQEKYSYVVKARHIDEKRPWSNKIFCDETVLDQPLHWRKSKRIFVCSMSDLFHPKVPFGFIDKVFNVIYHCSEHTFLVLTKRVERMAEVANLLIKAHGEQYFRHVHWGTSISTQTEAENNIPFLLQIKGAAVRWLSIEPMLGEIGLDRSLCICKHWKSEDGRNEPPWHPEDITKIQYKKQALCSVNYQTIDWVVVGGESGPGARPMHPDWVRNICDQCVAANVPFYFKQWGRWKPGRSEWSPGKPITKARWIEPDGSYSKWDLTQAGTPYHITRKGLITPLGKSPECDSIFMTPVGKKKADCKLDGKEWKQLPERR